MRNIKKYKNINKVNRSIKKINKMNPLSKHMEIHATAICFNRLINFDIKKESFHAHLIHSAGKYPAHVTKKKSLFLSSSTLSVWSINVIKREHFF